VRGDDWRRYAAPAAFLLAATLAVVLIRSGLENGGSTPRTRTATTGAASSVSTAPSTTTTRTTARRPAKRFWTVQAGDTFGVISSKSGVPVSRLERLNPNVKSTSLFVGERLRIR
jgi:LysM repeat protein